MPVNRFSGLYLPSLTTLQSINHNFRGMHVEVVQIEGKGLGLVAKRNLSRPLLVAYYLCKKVSVTGHIPSDYCVGADEVGYVLNIYDGSFPPPGADNIPYVAPFANEPTEVDGQPNAYLKDPVAGYRYELWTTRSIAKGEEIVWDYGPSYGKRLYPSKYN